VADQYVDEDYLADLFGRDTIAAVVTTGAISLDVHINAGTALIQSYLRNNGYATPATTTDQTVMLATAGAIWQTLSSIPSVSLKLPENWQTHPAFIAYTGILSGDAPVTHSLTTTTAIGGSKFTATTAGLPGAIPPRATRDNLGGY
jgi:hypothetical protein